MQEHEVEKMSETKDFESAREQIQMGGFENSLLVNISETNQSTFHTTREA
jgi:hypothetical protein